MSDEDRYDEEQAEKTKRAARKERSRLSSTRPVLGGSKKRSQTAASQRPEGDAKR
jgi:hypothetical protein